jgi:hypothetical protein
MYLNQYPEYVLPETKREIFPLTLFTIIKGKNTPRAGQFEEKGLRRQLLPTID